MKDHEKRELVNALTKVAVEFGGTQQLRERIAHLVLPALADQDAEIAALKATQVNLMSSLTELLCMPREDDAKSTAERIARIGRARKAMAQAVKT